MKWISLEDNFPPIDLPVLVFVRESDKLSVRLGTLIIRETCDDCEPTSECSKNFCENWDIFPEFKGYDYEITHWMPLPKGPNEVD